MNGTVVGIIQIPCGHCIGCRLEYSKQWSDRLMLESLDHENNFFITLTYDDAHLPDPVLIEKDGMKFWAEPLSKKDITKFLHDIRQKIAPDKIRFFICGEYGPATMRPHYHGILFGLNLREGDEKLDLVPTRHYNEIGQQIFESRFLEKIWNKGSVEIGTVTPQSCSYVARYCMKKVDGFDRSYYLDIGLEPEFLRMSKHPGIGHNQIIKDLERGLNSSYKIDSGSKSIMIKDNRYAKKLRRKYIPEIQEESDINAKFISYQIKKNKINSSDITYINQLKIEENNKKDSIKSLKRREL